MSADLLRRAAAVLREHAEAAPAEPWVSLDNGDRLLAIREDEAPGYRYLVDEPVDGPTAAYFALMHPPVALALADLLDIEAGIAETTEAIGMRLSRSADAVLALARTILREPEVTS